MDESIKALNDRLDRIELMLSNLIAHLLDQRDFNRDGTRKNYPYGY